jgi:hypothetical protein
MNEAALAIAHAADTNEALVRHSASFLVLVKGLKLGPGSPRAQDMRQSGQTRFHPAAHISTGGTIDCISTRAIR